MKWLARIWSSLTLNERMKLFMFMTFCENCVDIAGVARRLFANLNREVVAGVFEFGQLKLCGRVEDFF
jgi:hypothetical protein